MSSQIFVLCLLTPVVVWNMVSSALHVAKVLLSRVLLFVIPSIVANLTPLSMNFSKQEYWSG